MCGSFLKNGFSPMYIQQFSVALACRKNVLMTQFLFTILAAVFKNICRDVENKRKIDLNQ